MTLTKARAAATVIVALALALSGCGSTEPSSDGAAATPSSAGTPATSSPTAQPGTRYEVVTIEQTVPEEWTREAGPRPDVSADLVGRMSDLGVDLWQYQRTQQPEADVWVSPVSVYQVLSLLAPGVGADALEELLAAMVVAPGEMGVNTEELADWIAASQRSDYRMALYNAAFVARQYGGFAPSYLEDIEPIRNEVGGFDAGDPQGAADLINGRVDAHSRGMIEQIVAPGDITPDLVTILLNTTYFKGAWVDPFDPVFTGDGDFTLLDGTVVTIESMGHMLPLAVTAGDGYSAAMLPYEGGAKAVIVLPDEGRFEDVAAGLTVATLTDAAAAEVGEESYWVDLPKFTSDTGIQELVPALQSVGVRQMFVSTPDWPMFGNEDEHAISFVNHRVVVAVNELGTEAAAATAVGGIGGAGPEFAFRVNRPFLMAILDADDAVLFLGQVTDPR